MRTRMAIGRIHQGKMELIECVSEPGTATQHMGPMLSLMLMTGAQRPAICGWCKTTLHSGVGKQISHGICDACTKKYFTDVDEKACEHCRAPLTPLNTSESHPSECLECESRLQQEGL